MLHNESEMPGILTVNSPLSGTDVDVLPYLEAIEEAKIRGVSLAEQIQQVHDFLSTVYLDRGNTLTPEELAQLCHICVDIRNNLKSISL
jgi:hypothetical protein